MFVQVTIINKLSIYLSFKVSVISYEIINMRIHNNWVNKLKCKHFLDLTRWMVHKGPEICLEDSNVDYCDLYSASFVGCQNLVYICNSIPTSAAFSKQFLHEQFWR